MCLRADAPVFIPGAVAAEVAVQPAAGDQLIQNLAAAMTPSHINSPSSALPVAGIFCPYCIAGSFCAFHKATDVATAKHLPYNANRSSRTQLTVSKLYSKPDSNGSLHRRHGSRALDIDCEDTSTDVGGSETWCAVSDASDASSSHGATSHAGASSHESGVFADERNDAMWSLGCTVALSHATAPKESFCALVR